MLIVNRIRYMISEKDKFEAFFNYASMGILIADKEGRIERVNQLLLQQFGYADPAELIGQQVEKLIPSHYAKKHKSHRDHFVQEPERRVMGVGRDLFGLRKDGRKIPVEVSLSHYSDGNEFHIIAFVSDISLRKEIEQAVIRQKEELAANVLKIEKLNDELEEKVAIRTRQLQEAMHHIEASRDELSRALEKEKELSDLKTRFVSMASHEFRTPLSTILSSASLLAKYKETEEQEKRDRHIGRIKSSVNNLSGILDEFLSIGKIENGKIEVHPDHFNLRNLIQNVCQEMKIICKPGQQLDIKYQGVEMVCLDPSLMRNILINLLSNAIKFSSDKGVIEISANVSGTDVVISVKDHGIGISEKDQQHLFERFFRAANATNIPGTGLGLHIVSKYVDLMQGEVSFHSVLEEGTCFTLKFKPLEPTAAS